jgi:hypothetical protein
MAETVTSTLTGAQAQDVHVYQSAIETTYACTTTTDGDGTIMDFGKPHMARAKITMTTFTGSTPLLDAKLQTCESGEAADMVDVADGAFTQLGAAGDEALLVLLDRYVRVVRNYTNAITVADWNVVVTF